jgi:DNA-binding transcriptional ArsR family regulator
MPSKSEDPTQALLKALRHPLRRELLRRFLEATEPLGPAELAASMTQPLSNLSYHVRELARFGAVEIAEEEPRRGSVAHFYEAAALVRETPWALAALDLQPEQKGSNRDIRDTTDDEEALHSR